MSDLRFKSSEKVLEEPLINLVTLQKEMGVFPVESPFSTFCLPLCWSAYINPQVCR